MVICVCACARARVYACVYARPVADRCMPRAPQNRERKIDRPLCVCVCVCVAICTYLRACVYTCVYIFAFAPEHLTDSCRDVRTIIEEWHYISNSKTVEGTSSDLFRIAYRVREIIEWFINLIVNIMFVSHEINKSNEYIA